MVQARTRSARAAAGAAAAATVLLVASGLAGCSDSPEPSTLQSPSPAASHPAASHPATSDPATHAGDTATTTPEPPATHTTRTPTPDSTAALKKQAIAFMKRYLQAQNHLQTEQDIQEVEEFFTPQCSLCKSSTSLFKEHIPKGHKIEGGRFLDPKVTVDRVGSGFMKVMVVADVEAGRVVDQNGREIAIYPPSKNISMVYTIGVKADGSLLIVRGSDLS